MAKIKIFSLPSDGRWFLFGEVSIKRYSGRLEKEKHIYSGLKIKNIFEAQNCQNRVLFLLPSLCLDWSPALTMQFILILLLQKLSTFEPGFSHFHPRCKLLIAPLGHSWPCICNKGNLPGFWYLGKCRNQLILSLTICSFRNFRERFNFFCQLKNLRKKKHLQVCLN